MQLPHLINDDDTETPLPFKWEICGHCDGHGTSSAYLGAFTLEDLDEQGPEFCEDYFSGAYDRPCPECDGTGKVAFADRAKMTPAQVEEWDAQCKAFRDLRAEEEAERRFGC